MSVKRHENIRRFNRAVLNPITRLFAGNFFYSLVFHTGRSSGKKYSTPIVAAIKDDLIFIPLPYGADTDWFLNVQAKGECLVKIKGKRYSSIHPLMVDSATALSAFSSSFQRAFQRTDINQFLQLSII
jgi:deazaflavin-dependent oxidoreductase (nitroreductase family)